MFMLKFAVVRIANKFIKIMGIKLFIHSKKILILVNRFIVYLQNGFFEVNLCLSPDFVIGTPKNFRQRVFQWVCAVS